MSERMTWQKFRKTHTGLNKEQKSILWDAYKEDEEEYHHLCEKFAVQITTEEVAEITEVEEVEEVEEISVKGLEKSEPVSEESFEEMVERYNKITRKLDRFERSMRPEVKLEANNLLLKYAKATIPADYTCEETDAWELWLGPTQESLLINATRETAFICTRSWWSTHFMNARYVERRMGNPETLERMKARYGFRKKLLHRSPLIGIEIKLPTTARDFKLRS